MGLEKLLQILTAPSECIIVVVKILSGGNVMEGYCVKCKAKKEMKNTKTVTMKNKKPATTGTCSTCGTKMYKIGKAK